MEIKFQHRKDAKNVTSKNYLKTQLEALIYSCERLSMSIKANELGRMRRTFSLWGTVTSP